MSIVENAENIIETLNEIEAIQSGARAFLRVYGGQSGRARKAAYYIGSGKWQESPTLIASYGALYRKFLTKLPDGKRTGEQTVKALEWFYERLYVKWELEGNS